MAAQVEELSWQDCEKAVARIWSRQPGDTIESGVVGTGFLIAPGYVLTCAHVVLQSLGIGQEEFKTKKHPPEALITLDFPIRPNPNKIQAEIVEWLPYDVSKGDIAVLKLKGVAPSDALPLPITGLSVWSAQDKFSVYGFGKTYGDKSEAYMPKTGSAGGRLQLCKTGDLNDETIKEGYSGGPVWYEKEGEKSGCIIGMIATVDEGRADRLSKAFAITKAVLEPVLKKVSALHLEDVLVQGIEDCTDGEQKRRFEGAIAQTLKFCNPNGDLALDPKARTRKAQLCALATDLPSSESWQSEGKLVWFVMQLAMQRMGRLIPQHAYDAIIEWVGQCQLDFAMLLARAVKEIPEQGAPQLEQRNLIVLIARSDDPVKDLDVSMWAVSDRESLDLGTPPECIFLNELMACQDLPKYIRNAIRTAFATDKPIVHLFVPLDFLDQNLEMQSIPAKRRKELGCRYPFVLRVNLDGHPVAGSEYYQAIWQKKWSNIEAVLSEKTADVFKPIDCSSSALLSLLEDSDAVILNNLEDVADLFEEAFDDEIAVPAAIWVRGSSCATALSTFLEKEGQCGELIECIRKERERAHDSGEKTALGYNLSLLWEDPKIVPPTTMALLNSEDC